MKEGSEERKAGHKEERKTDERKGGKAGEKKVRNTKQKVQKKGIKEMRNKLYKERREGQLSSLKSTSLKIEKNQPREEGWKHTGRKGRKKKRKNTRQKGCNRGRE